MQTTARLFDPRGLKPEDYRSNFPELRTMPEFEPLSANALIFVWYYANPTSTLVRIADDFMRVKEALSKSGYNPTKVVKDSVLKLRFNDEMAMAIDRMRRFSEDSRVEGRMMLDNIMKHYREIAKKDPKDYLDKDGNEDIVKYLSVTSKIIEGLPILITKLEEGFGITIKSEDEEDATSGISVADWYNKNN